MPMEPNTPPSALPDLASMRQNYAQASLDEQTVLRDPLLQFQQWLQAAIDVRAPEPSAMTLATVEPDGKPSTRVVLLKGLDARGLVWYTNYSSRKAHALAHQPFAALQFFWPALERLVRIEGHVDKISAEESDAYYRSRPLDSRIGAWASPQSQIIASRDVLAEGWVEHQAKQGQDPVRPEDWGGYRLTPDRWEFWQGRPSRLHDRLCFVRQTDGTWALHRLAP